MATFSLNNTPPGYRVFRIKSSENELELIGEGKIRMKIGKWKSSKNKPIRVFQHGFALILH